MKSSILIHLTIIVLLEVLQSTGLRVRRHEDEFGAYRFLTSQEYSKIMRMSPKRRPCISMIEEGMNGKLIKCYINKSEEEYDEDLDNKEGGEEDQYQPSPKLNKYSNQPGKNSDEDELLRTSPFNRNKMNEADSAKYINLRKTSMPWDDVKGSSSQKDQNEETLQNYYYTLPTNPEKSNDDFAVFTQRLRPVEHSRTTLPPFAPPIRGLSSRTQGFPPGSHGQLPGIYDSLPAPFGHLPATHDVLPFSPSPLDYSSNTFSGNYRLNDYEQARHFYNHHVPSLPTHSPPVHLPTHLPTYSPAPSPSPVVPFPFCPQQDCSKYFRFRCEPIIEEVPSYYFQDMYRNRALEQDKEKNDSNDERIDKLSNTEKEPTIADKDEFDIKVEVQERKSTADTVSNSETAMNKSLVGGSALSPLKENEKQEPKDENNYQDDTNGKLTKKRQSSKTFQPRNK